MMDNNNQDNQDPIDNSKDEVEKNEEVGEVEGDTGETDKIEPTEEENTEEPIIEETAISEVVEEDKKPVSEILYETGKQVGHFSLNYFKHIGSFMKDHVGAIQRIFGYSFKTHLGLSLIHAFIVSLIPFVFAIKSQLLIHNLGVGKYFQIWGPFLEMMLVVFALMLLFQWLLSFVLTAVEGLVEHHKVSLFRSLKAVNIIGIVMNPFLILSCILLLFPNNMILNYIILFIFISGLLFSSVMFIKTLVMSKIVTGDHLISILVLCCVVTLLVICFIYIFGAVTYHLIIKLYGAFFLGSFGM